MKHLIQLDSPTNQQLTAGEFDNVAASLQLTEAMLSGCSDQIQKQIQNVIVSTPGVARASSVLVEHLHDDGNLFLIILCILSSQFQEQVKPFNYMPSSLYC